MACSLEAGKITPCKGLEATLESPHGRGVRSRGLIFHHMVNLKTHEFTRNLVQVKSGGADIIANFCPFCGTQLLADDPEDTE